MITPEAAQRAAAWLRELLPRYPLGVEIVLEIATLIRFAEERAEKLNHEREPDERQD